MIEDSHAQTVPAHVRQRRIQRHAAIELDRGRGYMWAEALGPPRFWSTSLEITTSTFLSAFEEHRQSGSFDLTKTLSDIREALKKAGRPFLEPGLLNVAIAAFHFGPDRLQVLTTGSGRVYLHEQGRPTRLTPRGRDDRGVLLGRTVASDHPIVPNSLVLAGSDSTFSDTSVQKVAEALEKDGQIACTVLTSIATEAPRDRWGCVSIAARVSSI